MGAAIWSADPAAFLRMPAATFVRFFANHDLLEASPSLRMWEFYLCYCEGGFEERQIGVVQALFEKSGARLEPVLGRMS